MGIAAAMGVLSRCGIGPDGTLGWICNSCGLEVVCTFTGLSPSQLGMASHSLRGLVLPSPIAPEHLLPFTEHLNTKCIHGMPSLYSCYPELCRPIKPMLLYV